MIVDMSESRGRPRYVRAAVMSGAAALVLLLGACGGESDPVDPAEPSATTPAEAALPECAEVWRAGEILPRGYKGCMLDSNPVAVDALTCSSGQRLLRHENAFYAVRGGTIREAVDGFTVDAGYRSAVASCRG